MRETLFKAKRVDNEDWVRGYYLECAGETYICENPILLSETRSMEGEMYGFDGFYEVIPETMCLNSKLRDMRGIMIFEGDIIEIKGNYSADVIGNWEVYFSDICNNWSLRRNEEYHTCHLSFSDLNGFNEDSVIIGNVYDNPELMKEGE